jgi:hypothetical protein
LGIIAAAGIGVQKKHALSPAVKKLISDAHQEQKHQCFILFIAD